MLCAEIEDLIKSLQILSGVGRKNAQRMAFELLSTKREGGQRLHLALSSALDNVSACDQCGIMISRECSLCNDEYRSKSLCIVASQTDFVAIEATGIYKGYYFILKGNLSPIDGKIPSVIGINKLMQRVDRLKPEEVILATNFTVEGEATAQYIAEELRKIEVVSSRIAYGVPVGGELEYVNSPTIIHALNERKNIA